MTLSLPRDLEISGPLLVIDRAKLSIMACTSLAL
jgi:hypothetical protein